VVKLHYQSDEIMMQLVALDYYLHHKLKPKTLYLEEVSREEKTSIINELTLNHHKYRFMIFPFTFDVEEWLNQGEIINQNHTAIIQYDGETKAKIVSGKMAQQQ
jgi:hypothetical protein